MNRHCLAYSPPLATIQIRDARTPRQAIYDAECITAGATTSTSGLKIRRASGEVYVEAHRGAATPRLVPFPPPTPQYRASDRALDPGRLCLRNQRRLAIRNKGTPCWSDARVLLERYAGSCHTLSDHRILRRGRSLVPRSKPARGAGRDCPAGRAWEARPRRARASLYPVGSPPRPPPPRHDGRPSRTCP